MPSKWSFTPKDADSLNSSCMHCSICGFWFWVMSRHLSPCTVHRVNFWFHLQCGKSQSDEHSPATTGSGTVCHCDTAIWQQCFLKSSHCCNNSCNGDDSFNDKWRQSEQLTLAGEFNSLRRGTLCRNRKEDLPTNKIHHCRQIISNLWQNKQILCVSQDRRWWSWWRNRVGRSWMRSP